MIQFLKIHNLVPIVVAVLLAGLLSHDIIRLFDYSGKIADHGNKTVVAMQGMEKRIDFLESQLREATTGGTVRLVTPTKKVTAITPSPRAVNP